MSSSPSHPDDDINNDEDIDDLLDAGAEEEDENDKATDDDASDNDDDSTVVDARKFLDIEAELSGDEASSDEDENELDDDQEAQAENEVDEVVDVDEQRKQINEVFQKQEMDDDRRRLLELQERFFDDGELHGQTRQKMFKWKHSDNDVWNDRESDEDEGNEEEDGFNDEDTNSGVPQVKIIYKEVEDDNSHTGDGTSSMLSPPPALTKFKSAFGGNASKIDSYIIRDKKTLELMNHKTPSPEVQYLRKEIKKHKLKRRRLV